MMAAEFDENKPIYQKLMERVISEIVRDDIKVGDKLNSGRKYGVEVGVNVNTMQRVYRKIEYLEIVTTRRGQGTFVTENEQLLQQLREDRKQKIIKQFVEEMKNMGYSLNDMIEGIKVEERNRK